MEGSNPMKTLRLVIEKAKASIRTKVEYLHVIKNLFGYLVLRYKGLGPRTSCICSPSAI